MSVLYIYDKFNASKVLLFFMQMWISLHAFLQSEGMREGVHHSHQQQSHKAQEM